MNLVSPPAWSPDGKFFVDLNTDISNYTPERADIWSCGQNGCKNIWDSEGRFGAEDVKWEKDGTIRLALVLKYDDKGNPVKAEMVCKCTPNSCDCKGPEKK